MAVLRRASCRRAGGVPGYIVSRLHAKYKRVTDVVKGMIHIELRRYLPEGLRAGVRESAVSTREALRRAAETGKILEGRAVRCDAEKNILVELGGGLRGVIPRAEAAAGENVRDIAVITLVGKQVCFKVLDALAPLPVLSRRLAQQEARDALMGGLRPGDVIPVRVTHLEPFGAFVDMGCGLASLIGIENISVSRISHPAERFCPGQQAYAAVLSIDEELGRVNLTHRELLGTWEENAARFEPGDTVEGIVRGVEEYGSFIELAPNLSGLTERREGLEEGDRVSVFIKSIIPERMKVKLTVVEKLGRAEPTPVDYFICGGHISRWRYSPECCNTKLVERVFDRAD